MHPPGQGVKSEATLKQTAGGGFDLDLSMPGAHKTSAVFGPTITAVPPPACALLTEWVKTAGIKVDAQPYVFVRGKSADRSEPLCDWQWTRLVKETFKRHSGGVAFAPKDLRSSFITFLKSDANTDEVLKSAAFSMRHSDRQQAGPAYDKERGERLSAAAVKVAGEFAARF